MPRIQKHMVLPVAEKPLLSFFFDGKELRAQEGEVISTALIANDIHIFSRHHKGDAPQGIFCANGQCAQCTVIADGLPVKACITPVSAGMRVETLKGFPEIPAAAPAAEFSAVSELDADALIIGGGPAGLAAALELGALGASVIVLDDKHRLGGKLILQTHKFFGSVKDCHAGTRGIDIATKLETEISSHPNVKVWLNSYAVAVFSDKKVGVVHDGQYVLVRPRTLLVAAGAREKSLPFPGNTLPGVYGAGAFQTLVNRDLVAPSKRLFIIGGGNVGLIAAYHAVQAGIEVAGLAEGAAQVGGYKVHADKIKRLGIPVFTSHTVLRAEGRERVERVVLAEVDKDWRPIRGTEKVFGIDTLLVAVGLNPCDELYTQAVSFGMNVYSAGDAQEIAEASAAIFSGRIAGRKMALNLGLTHEPMPKDWEEKLSVLKSRPGPTAALKYPETRAGVFPVFHCAQEIPCNPCSSVCPKKAIKMRTEAITSLPVFDGECLGCGKCVAICPGLAVTLVDYRKDPNFPLVAIPFEINRGIIKPGDFVKVTDAEGKEEAVAEVAQVQDIKSANTLLVYVKVDRAIAPKVAGITLFEHKPHARLAEKAAEAAPDDAIICRCERVTAGDIRKAIRSGVRDLNQLKALTRAGMGACGAKTCETQILALFRSEGVKPEEVTRNTQRPLAMEVFLGQFANAHGKTARKPGFDSGKY